MAPSGDEDASQTAAALTAAAGADDAGPMANAPALPAPPRASRQYGCRRCGAPVRKGCGCKNQHFQVSNRDECVMSSNLQGGLCGV